MKVKIAIERGIKLQINGVEPTEVERIDKAEATIEKEEVDAKVLETVALKVREKTIPKVFVYLYLLF